MRLARVGPRDWIVHPSRLAISLLRDGPSPSSAIAERYCRSAGVARAQREWKEPCVERFPAVGDGDEYVAVGDCWSWRDVPCGAAVFLQEVRVPVGFVGDQGGGRVFPLDAFGVRGVGEYASGVGGVEVLDRSILEHPLGVRRCGG